MTDDNSMTDDFSDQRMAIDSGIKQSIEDGQRLIAYIAKDGMTQLPDELTRAMIEAKYQAAAGEWSAEDEATFLVNYDRLTKIIYPVTIESINAIIPDKSEGAVGKTKAERAVASYRRYTLFSLVLLLLVQLYWLVGNNLRINLQDIFEQRETQHATLIKGQVRGSDAKQLELALDLSNQQLDANYQLLRVWNRVSTVGVPFSGDMPEYTKERLGYKDVASQASDNNKTDKTEENEKVEKRSAVSAELERDLYKARIMYFKNILAADFFLEALQSYILPLIYGLLGALIYVLRSLLKEIKLLTYTFDSEIRFRLRITLGSLGGMVVGWFFKPQGVDSLASLSPMAMAFLMGYNVDLLFSMMDKMIDNIRDAIEKPPAPTPPQAEQTKKAG